MRSRDELALIASIADDLPVGVLVVTAANGAFVYANHAFDEIMGVDSPSNRDGTPPAALDGLFTRSGEPYPADSLPCARAVQTRAVVVADDLAIHRCDGRRVFVRAQAKPLFGSNGDVTHVAVVFLDITREVEAERDAAAVREQLREVVAGAPVTLSAFGADGIVTFVAGRGLAALGRPEDAYLGTSMLESYGPEVAAYARRAIAGEPVRYTLEFEGRSYEAQLTPRRNEAGDTVGVIGVSVDVTDARRAEAKLAQAERLASLGLLAAGVAHEVNNPITYVLGSLEAAERSLDGGAPDLRALPALLRDARGGIRRIASIVRDLKTFSRVQADRTTRVAIRGPLEAAIAMARGEVRDRAKLVVDIAPELYVLGSEGRLAQLFLNLLINAAHAVESGAADQNEIAVTARTAGDDVVVTVRDTGTGMTPDVLRRIFDPFFTTKAIGVGTGLGLSVCHAIVTDLGGTIIAESEPGRGTVMRVSLPLAPSPGDERAPVAVSLSAAGRRGSVLVVDDELAVARTTQLVLEEEHDVVYETRAAAALDRLRHGERFDVILCDVTMPEMTGIELYAEVRRLASDQAEAMIFFTGGAITDQARRFLADVSNFVIEKPFDCEQLAAIVRRRVL